MERGISSLGYCRPHPRLPDEDNPRQTATPVSRMPTAFFWLLSRYFGEIQILIYLASRKSMVIRRLDSRLRLDRSVLSEQRALCWKEKAMRLLLLGLATAALFPVSYWASYEGAGAQSSAALSFPCDCRISKDDLSGKVIATGTVQIVPVGPQPNFNACHSACGSSSFQHVGSQSVATASCNANPPAPNGRLIRAYNKISGIPASNFYTPARVIGTLVNTPASTQHVWRCPATWLSNTSNQSGDVTTDGRCKRVAGPIIITPLPDNGTQIGSWGFTWNDRIFAYGSPANGGAAVMHTTQTPAVCSF